VPDTCLFSAIIPTYNRAPFLPEALDSVLTQGLSDTELIVVDDGSTDETKAVIAGYGDRVKYVYQHNRGPASAKNRGVMRATGKFISFLDSDDVWLPAKMRTELDLFERFPTADVIVSDCKEWIDGKLFSDSWIRRRLIERGIMLPLERPSFMPGFPPIWTLGKLYATSCMTLKRGAFQRLGSDAFDESLRSFEDWDFEIRMLRWCQVLIVPEVLATIRRFDDGTRNQRAASRSLRKPLKAIELYTSAIRRRRVIEKALDLGDWPQEVIASLLEIKAEMEQTIAESGDSARPETS
jgi:glycosyltransferase involved in cell wall biosynthesis